MSVVEVVVVMVPKTRLERENDGQSRGWWGSKPQLAGGRGEAHGKSTAVESRR